MFAPFCVFLIVARSYCSPSVMFRCLLSVVSLGFVPVQCGLFSLLVNVYQLTVICLLNNFHTTIIVNQANTMSLKIYYVNKNQTGYLLTFSLKTAPYYCGVKGTDIKAHTLFLKQNKIHISTIAVKITICSRSLKRCVSKQNIAHTQTSLVPCQQQSSFKAPLRSRKT